MNKMIQKKVVWGILGTGSIARVFAKGISESKTGRILAVASRNLETANSFGDDFQVPVRYDNYEKLLNHLLQ